MGVPPSDNANIATPTPPQKKNKKKQIEIQNLVPTDWGRGETMQICKVTSLKHEKELLILKGDT